MKYIRIEKELTSDNIEDFLKKYLENKLNPSFKSEVARKSDLYGYIIKLTAKTFNYLFSYEQKKLVYFHKNQLNEFEIEFL